MKRMKPFPSYPYRFLLLLLVLHVSRASFAGDTLPPVDVAHIKIGDTLESRMLYYTDSLHRLLPEQLPFTHFSSHIPAHVLRQLTPAQVEKDWWLSFRLANTA